MSCVKCDWINMSAINPKTEAIERKNMVYNRKMILNDFISSKDMIEKSYEEFEFQQK